MVTLFKTQQRKIAPTFALSILLMGSAHPIKFTQEQLLKIKMAIYQTVKLKDGWYIWERPPAEALLKALEENVSDITVPQKIKSELSDHIKNNLGLASIHRLIGGAHSIDEAKKFIQREIDAAEGTHREAEEISEEFVRFVRECPDVFQQNRSYLGNVVKLNFNPFYWKASGANETFLRTSRLKDALERESPVREPGYPDIRSRGFGNIRTRD